MIRLCIIAVFSILTSQIYSQDKFKIKKEKPVSKAVRKKAIADSLNNIRISRSFNTLDFVYGYRIFSNGFYSRLNELNSFSFQSPPAVIGFGFSSYDWAIGARSNLGCQMLFTYALPGHFDAPDSLKAKINGFSYHFGIGKTINRLSSKFQINVNIGFNTGRLLLTYPDNLKRSNAFFSPKIGVHPKLRIWKKIFVSLTIDFEKDVSKVNWKSVNKAEALSLNGFDQTGLVSLISIGIIP